MGSRRAVGATILIFLGVLTSARSGPIETNHLRNIYSWKSLEFAFPSPEAREAAINDGDFIPGKPLPIDVDTHHGDRFGRRIFVTIPRFQEGVPVTLGQVTNDLAPDGSPLIAPFPNWDWQSTHDCDSMTSVWRIAIDRCGRLWALDAGKIEETQHCPPQLLVFSLRTNELLSRYKFPNDQYRESSLFVTPVVDVRGSQCEDTFVYVADVTGFAIVVYDHQNARSWRISNNLFYPYPHHGTFHIKDDVFDLMDGVLGMTLSPHKPYGDRTLYFHSLASKVESRVSTSVIRNYALFHNNSEAASRDFRAFENERSSQSAAEAMDKNGVMYFGLLSELAIGCWNSKNYDYGDENIERVVIDSNTLQFPSGIKVITAKDGRQELWVITVSFQRFMTGTLTPSETNFRIQAAVVDELVRGTKCDVASITSNTVKETESNPGGDVVFPE